MEHPLARCRVTFHAACVSKGRHQLQRGNLVFWLLDGALHSVELTGSPSHRPSDLVDWCGFSILEDDPLAWCREEGIDLTLVQEEKGGQWWMTPSGASLTLQDGKVWNVTLVL